MTQPNAKPIAGLEEIIAADVYKHAHWGLAVADLETGERLAEINPEALFVPASTTKLWSAAAALDTLGADYRFETPVYQRGELTADGALEGDLVLRASGDPMLGGRVGPDGRLAFTSMDHTLADFFDNTSLPPANPLAGIEDLARQIAKRGIRRVRDVLVDDRLIDRSDPYYTEPVRPSAVMINDNIVDLLITPGASVGSPAALRLSPPTGYLQVETRIETVAAGAGTQVQVRRLAATRFAVEGKIELGREPLIKIAWIEEPQDFARTLLIECLEAQGVQVERSQQPPVDSAALPAEAAYAQLPVAAKLVSLPLAETLRVTLKVSHNTIADLLPMLVAAHTGGRGIAAGMHVQGAFAERIGVEPGSVSLADGAGGSNSDRVSPRAALRLLRAMAVRPDFAVYHEALPILGVDGTLAHAVKPESPVCGQVQAKTGTLMGENLLNGTYLVSSKALAGYMTAHSGRKLVFALFLNDVCVPTIDELMRQGEVLGAVCEKIYLAY